MLDTVEAISSFNKNKSHILNSLSQLHDQNFEQAKSHISIFQNFVEKSESLLNNQHADNIFNEFYLLKVLCSLLISYISFWQKISKSEFSESWVKLQDAQDILRVIFRLSSTSRLPLLEIIEKQCGELEKLYPYNVFMSTGMVIKEVECNICGKSINSFDCEHIIGELYRGKMAQGRIKEIKELNHVALVEKPANKRCVVKYENDAKQFRLVKYLGGILNKRLLSPLAFSNVEYKTITLAKDELPQISRNAKCFCGSNKKYKKCCIYKETVEKQHVDIVGSPSIDAAKLNNSIKLTCEPVHSLGVTEGCNAPDS